MAEFEHYERRLAGILARFSENREGIHIDRADDGPYRQYVRELIDLFNDVMPYNEYARRINTHFVAGIQNFYETPSYKSVENILGVLRAAITRLKRRPELLSGVDPREKTAVALQASAFVTSGGRGQLEATATPDLIELHTALMVRVAALEYALAQRPPSVPGIGHNNPPDDISERAEPNLQDIAEIEEFISVLKAEPPNPPKRPDEILVRIEKFEAAGKKFRDYFDGLATKAFESVGTELGKVVVSPQSWFWLNAAWAIRSVSEAATQWLHALPH